MEKTADAFRTISESRAISICRSMSSGSGIAFHPNSPAEARRRPTLLSPRRHRTSARHSPASLRRGLHDQRRAENSQRAGLARRCHGLAGRGRDGAARGNAARHRNAGRNGNRAAPAGRTARGTRTPISPLVRRTSPSPDWAQAHTQRLDRPITRCSRRSWPN